MQTRYVRLAHPAASPCEACGKRYMVTDKWTSKARKFCSVECKSRAQRKSETKKCIECQGVKPYDEFSMLAGRTRARRCLVCFQPPAEKTKLPFCQSTEPCHHCREPYALRVYASRMARIKFCSKTCRVGARTNARKTCGSCRRPLPAERFAYQPSGKSRRQTCEECCLEREALKKKGAGHRMSCGQMVAKARSLAGTNGYEFNVSAERIKEIYNAPCALCGAKSCSMMRIYPDLDYTDDNVEGRCWMCSMFQRGRGVQVDDDVVIAHARAIVRWAER